MGTGRSKIQFKKCILAVMLCLSMLAVSLPPMAIPPSAEAASGGGVSMAFVIGQNTYTINGVTTTMDVSPTVIEDRTMLPIRFVAEPLGAAVNWDEATEKVTVQLMDTKIELWIGQSNALVSGVSTPIDPDNPNVKPLTLNDRTMLPVRFVTENLGCDVGWNEETQQVSVVKAAGGSDLTDTEYEEPADGEDDPDYDTDDTGDGAILGSRFSMSSLGEVTFVDTSRPSLVETTRPSLIAGNLASSIRTDTAERMGMAQSNEQQRLKKDYAELFKAMREDTETDKAVTMSNKSGIQTIMDLGCGYDVFDRYATGLSLKQEVLDMDKLIKDGQVRNRIYAYGDFAELEGSSISEYAEDMTTKANIHGGYMGFKASVDTSFTSAYTSKSTSYYHTINWLVMNDNLYIKSAADLRQYVLPEVKTLLDTGKMNGVARTEKWIFDNYGGYVLVDGIFGGRLEYNVAADSTYCTSYENFKLNVKASYSNAFGSISAELDHDNVQNRADFLSHSSTTVKTYGGRAQDGHSLTASQQTVSALQEWNTSIPDRQVLVEFGSNRDSALVPIWELCGNPERAAKLESEFIKYADDPSRKLAVPVEVMKIGTVYELQNFGGASIDLYAEREYRNLATVNIGNESSPTNFNKMISSIRVWQPGYRVIAYTGTNYSGPFIIYGNNTYGIEYSTVDYMIDNNISSLRVEKATAYNDIAAVVYEDNNYSGKAQQLTVGDYPLISNATGSFYTFVGNDKISSIRVNPGYEITVYQHENYGGYHRDFTGNVSSLGSYNMYTVKAGLLKKSYSWNDVISSIKVRKK